MSITITAEWTSDLLDKANRLERLTFSVKAAEANYHVCRDRLVAHEIVRDEAEADLTRAVRPFRSGFVPAQHITKVVARLRDRALALRLVQIRHEYLTEEVKRAYDLYDMLATDLLAVQKDMYNKAREV